MKGIKGWIKDILIACVIALLVMAFIKPTIVQESSMQPTLYTNNYIFLSRQAYLLSEPSAGDIVVFNSDLRTADGNNKLLIKRVIAVPGDRVTIADGNVYINGELQEEPYLYENETSGNIDNLIVPEGKVFVMGDNRRVSIDSRSEQVGSVPVSDIVGRAFFRLYPFNRIGMLH
ncbi:MAG: signal peptidase I [Clostridiales bacterium]|nr:signal peptidase I [Clostridiales bacterium]